MTKKRIRLDYLDIAKGIAILFVVIGHVPDAFDAPLYRVVLYTFHMPLFFIVSGWVIFYFSDDAGGLPAMLEFIPRLFDGGLISPDALVVIRGSLLLLAAACAASTPVIRKAYFKLRERKGFAAAELIAAALILVLACAAIVGDSYNPFLYFKF